MQLQANNRKRKSVAGCQNRQQPNKAGHLKTERQTDNSTHYNTEKENMKSIGL